MIPQEFLTIFAAFGFSAAAGLNAWVTMLIVSIAAHFGWLQLAEPYDVMGHPGVILALLIITIIEGLADKIPAMDHASHILHTVIQPAAGAILFASQGGVITEISLPLAFILGALISGSIHTGRMTLRPFVNFFTAGFGTPFVSAAEDGAAIGITILALVAPILAVFAVVAIVAFGLIIWRRRRHRRRAGDAAI